MIRMLLALVLIAGPALAQDTLTSAIAELQAGVICAPEVISTVPAPDTVAGVSNIIDADPEFVTAGRVVPAVIGIGFAIKARSAKRDYPFVTMVITHPPMGDAGATRQSYDSSIGRDALSLTAWQFEYDYELVPGPWTISAYDGEALLFTVAFDVVPPAMLPELASRCGYEDLLS